MVLCIIVVALQSVKNYYKLVIYLTNGSDVVS